MTPSRNTRIFSWALYDFANTIFSMNILSLYFPLWVTGELGGKDIHYSVALSLSVLMAAVSMPVIGACSDQRKSRMPWLIVLTLISCAFTVGLGAIKPELYVALALFAVANFGFLAALVPYDSLLPEVSAGERVGWVSGLGVSLGYLGSIGGLLMVRPFVSWHGRAAAFIPTGLLFLVFSLPLFFVVRDPAERPPKKPLKIRRGFRRIRNTVLHTRRYPGLLRFLVSNLLYSDAVNTVIVFMAVYASKVIGMSDASINTFLQISTVFAAVGAIAAGKITDYLGPKRTLMLVLSCWTFTLLLACASFSKTLFWAVGPLAGISLGGTWVSSRALVVRLTPPRKFGEVYGLYNLGGKFGFVLGPLVWGGIVLLFEPLGLARYRLAIFSLVLFILAAMAMLRKVPGGKPGEERS